MAFFGYAQNFMKSVEGVLESFDESVGSLAEGIRENDSPEVSSPPSSSSTPKKDLYAQRKKNEDLVDNEEDYFQFLNQAKQQKKIIKTGKLSNPTETRDDGPFPSLAQNLEQKKNPVHQTQHHNTDESDLFDMMINSSVEKKKPKKNHPDSKKKTAPEPQENILESTREILLSASSTTTQESKTEGNIQDSKNQTEAEENDQIETKQDNQIERKQDNQIETEQDNQNETEQDNQNETEQDNQIEIEQDNQIEIEENNQIKQKKIKQIETKQNDTEFQTRQAEKNNEVFVEHTPTEDTWTRADAPQNDKHPKEEDFEIEEFMDDNASEKTGPKNEKTRSQGIEEPDPQQSISNFENSQVSELQEENLLLRKEVISLNREIKSMEKKLKLNDETQNHNNDLEKQIYEAKKGIVDLERKNQEVNLMLTSKNEQIETLASQLDEMKKTKQLMVEDSEMLKKKNLNLEKQFEWLRQNQETAIKKLEEKLKKMQNEKDDEIDQKNQLSKKLFEVEEEFEKTRQTLEQDLTSLQNEKRELENENQRTTQQLKHSEHQRNLSEKELNEYQERAKRVLQEKENLITNLSKQLEDPSQVAEGPSNVDFLQITQHKEQLERDLHDKLTQIEKLQNELIDTNETLETVKNDFQELTEKARTDASTYQSREKTLQNDILQKISENNQLRQDLEEQKHSFVKLNAEKETEIQSLRRQLSSKQHISSNQEEAERRIQQITEHLIQKQNQLETVLSEKAYLQFQLESSKKQDSTPNTSFDDLTDSLPITRTSSIKRRGQSIVSLIHSENEPQDESHVIKGNVIKAAKALDSVNVYTGKWLSDFPLLRLAFLVYVLLLHWWVIFMTLSTTAEIHDVENDTP